MKSHLSLLLLTMSAVMAFGAQCATIETKIEIEAPRAAVWQQLHDTEHYPDWNPFIRSLSGEWKQGETLNATIQPVGKSAMSFSPEVLEVEEQSVLEWRGRLAGIPGLFTGQHRFELVELGPARTELRQSEHFSGCLVPLFDLTPTEQGFHAMNRAIKERAEEQFRRRP